MSDPFVGEIRMFAGNFAPNGWSFCNGQLLPINQFEALFTLVGTSYGGDGQNTFGLPNLQGRFPLHQGNSFMLGQVGGSETVTLTSAQMPAHNHIPQGSATGTVKTTGGNVWAGTPTLGQFVEGTAANETMSPGALQTVGGGLSHDNIIPYLAINFIISLFGVFPSQN